MRLKVIIFLIFSVLFIQFAFADSNSSRINTAGEGKEEPGLSGEVQESAEKIEGVPVFFEDKELFKIYSNIGPFSAEERSGAISARLQKIKEAASFRSGTLFIVESDTGKEIIHDNIIIMSVTEGDAVASGKAPGILAEEYVEKIREVLISQPVLTIVNQPSDLYRFFVDNRGSIIRGAIALGALILLGIIILFASKIFNRIYLFIENGKGTLFKSVSISGNEIISDETVASTLVMAIRGIKLAVYIGFLYAFISILFLLFPGTKSPLIKEFIKGIFLTVLTAAIGFGIYKTLKMIFELLRNNISRWKGTIIKSLKVKTVNILSEEQIVEILKKALMVLHVSINLFILYIFIPIVLSFFKFTSTWADTLFGYILTPLKTIIISFVGFIPNLFFIAVIIFVNRFLIKFVRLIFDEIRAGNIELPNFYREWADPTFKIVRTLIIIFTVIVVFPYLPGSDSEAFKGVSIFLGILFSLGSTSVIANVVAGTILTYMYAFKIGDRVKIGDTTGDVIEKTLLVTRINTTKNIIITIPNAIVMNSHIINFSTSAEKDGIILHTTVTLGYDVPWRKVHEVLKDAALSTPNVLPEPVPFVLQTSLDDFYVSYELNCYTVIPNVMGRTYSELHQKIQDKCNEAGIEILSPHYAAARDGNATTIPADYLPATYEAPSFAVKIVNKLAGQGDKNNGQG